MDEIYTSLDQRVEAQLGHDITGVDQNWRHRYLAASVPVQNALYTVSFQVFLEHPPAFVASLLLGAARMYGYTQNLPTIILIPELLWNMVFLVGTVWGLVLAFKDRQWYLFWTVLLVCVYFTAGTLAVKTAA